jgi:para-aminobenzoate synthetase/4-amino-4-deoxychorismate lyase
MTNQLVIHDAQLKQWFRFREPEQIVRAFRLDQVVPSLELVELMVREHKMYAAGFISYEASPAFDTALHTHSLSSFPLLWFGLYKKAEIIQLPAPAQDSDNTLNWSASVSREEYDQAIATIKEHIARGETYQVNYTMRLHTPFSGNPWELFLKLVRSQQADYAAYVDLDQFAICSASPELFFRFSGNHLTLRPMKGTVARGYTLSEDNAMAEWLHHSEKNRAENVMIVDMIRNDMGRVADINSVQVPSLFDVEQYPTLWQMTSTVTATTSACLGDIMAALFPCASITGAPKPRTMEIIRNLEKTPRGMYTGCIGFISPKRQAQFNVAIRTVVIDKTTNQAEYGVGSGIVWDSLSSNEYTECQLKTRVLTTNRPDFCLLETMLWEPDHGYFLLSYHLKRLQDSALYFCIPVDIEQVHKKLEALANSLPTQSYKVRLLVAQDGNLACESTLLCCNAASQPVSLSLSSTPVDSSNPFLYHKTTERQVYNRALASCPNYDDVLLWNERGEITETCIANVIVQINGELLTPPVQCGVLAGTFRAYLLDQGKIREEIITVEALKQCERIYRVNSVQKWREAVLVTPDQSLSNSQQKLC